MTTRVNYDTPQPMPRKMRPAYTCPQMTAAQQRAHEQTVAILRTHCDAAEAHLARRDVAAIEVGERVCPCGIVERDCQCTLWRSRLTP